MSITFQSTTLATPAAGTKVIQYSDGTDNHFPVEYITGGSAGSYTFQYVDSTHGLYVQPMTGATWALAASSAVIGHVIVDSGTVAATQSGTWNVTNISGTVSLPTGAATSALQTTGNTSLSSIDGKTPSLGQALAAASVPVVLTAAQLSTLTPISTVAATQSGSWSLAANQSVNVAQINGVTTSMGNGVSGTGVQRVTIASDSTGQVALAAGSAVIGHVIVDSGTVTTVSTVTAVTTVSTVTSLTQMNGQAIAMGTGVRSAGTQRVTIATDDVVPASQSGTWNVGLSAGSNLVGKVGRNTVTTATLSNVASSATSVTVLASNSSRIGGSFFNDSASACYLKKGATASATSFTVKIPAYGFYEIPEPMYTGIWDCIWDTATGTMRVTEEV